MGTEICQGYPAAVQATRPSPGPCILFRKYYQEAASVMGCRCSAHPTTSLPPPLLRWPPYPAAEYQPYSIQCCGWVGRAFHHSIRIHHVAADFPVIQPILWPPFFNWLAIICQHTTFNAL
jgi:hypothetical protein